MDLWFKCTNHSVSVNVVVLVKNDVPVESFYASYEVSLISKKRIGKEDEERFTFVKADDLKDN